MPIDASSFCPGSAPCARISLVGIRTLWVFLFLLFTGTPAIAQETTTTRNEFWPEIDVYINVKPKVRLYLLGTVSKSVEDGELRNAQGYEGQIGAHVDLHPEQSRHFAHRLSGRDLGRKQ